MLANISQFESLMNGETVTFNGGFGSRISGMWRKGTGFLKGGFGRGYDTEQLKRIVSALGQSNAQFETVRRDLIMDAEKTSAKLAEMMRGNEWLATTDVGRLSYDVHDRLLELVEYTDKVLEQYEILENMLASALGVGIDLDYDPGLDDIEI